MKLLKANEATASKRRVFFFCVDAVDGISAEVGETGGQPQVSTDGAAWTDTGIGVLVALGSGHYYAELTQTLIDTAGVVIATRYKSANTAEAPGTTVQVVAFDPDSATTLGLSGIGTAQTGDSYARLGAPAGASIAADIAAVEDTGNVWHD